MDDATNCLDWNKILPVTSDTGMKLIETLIEKHDLCIDGKTDGLFIIANGNIGNSTKLVEERFANKDGYLFVNKQHKWLPYPQRFGMIYLYLYVINDDIIFNYCLLNMPENRKH